MTADLLVGLARANLAASAAVIVVLLLRTPTARNLSARAAYALWMAVPLAALATLLPAREVIRHVSAPADAAALTAQAAQSAPLTTVHAAQFHLDPPTLTFAVWALGALALAGLLAWRQHRFGRTLGRLTPETGVYRAEASGIGPAVLGALFPRIVVPADFEARFTEAEREVILAHEQTHLRSGDHWVNVAVAAFQCLCWFNPLAHLAAASLRIDQELACDAAVMARRPEARKVYAEAMLKTQFCNLALPLGAQWPPGVAEALKLRITLLADVPSRPRQAAGAALVALLSLGAGMTAWAAQSPRVVTVTHVGRDAPVAAAVAVNDGTAPPGVSHSLDRGLVHAARVTDYRDAVRLLDAGADPNYRAPGHGTPLMQVARRDDPRLAKLLISHGADVDAAVRGDGNPLILAARSGHLATARVLVANGADVNRFVLYDETPLINAARSDDLAMVRYLVEHGADVNLVVPTGNAPFQTRSPLRAASSPAVKDYLRSQGARD